MNTENREALKAARDVARREFEVAVSALHDRRIALIQGDAEYQRLYRLTNDLERKAEIAKLEYQRDYASKPDVREAAVRALARVSVSNT